ncbi:hypothetical protein [Hahella ganghwensis]|uniref:hypothetical protein n=1 Tax=Hahella ganghwensis TaxID=286420 RepID=UPI00036322A3|nr:hypothetical protein [Hahella ganghwensis]
MSEYEIIDAICDKVNPLLFLIVSGLLVKDLYRRELVRASVRFGFLFSGLLLVYGFMLLDSKLGIWESFGGDYSTHTAFAIAVCVAISISIQWAKWVIGTLLLYAIAMLYQGYHSILDVVTTSIIIGLPLILFRLLIGGLDYAQDAPITDGSC